VGAVAPFLKIIVFAASMLVDVVLSVTGPSIVDKTLLGQYYLLASRWRL